VTVLVFTKWPVIALRVTFDDFFFDDLLDDLVAIFFPKSFVV